MVKSKVLSRKGFSYITLSIAILLWTTMFVMLAQDMRLTNMKYEQFPYRVVLFFSLNTLYYYIGQFVVTAKRSETTKQLRRFLILGVLLLILHLAVQNVQKLVPHWKSPFYIAFVYLFNVGILSLFLIYGNFTVRAFLLKNKSKKYDSVWKFFIVWLFLSMFFIFVPEWTWIQRAYLIIGVLIATYLASTPKWIAYLTKEEKLTVAFYVFGVLSAVILLWLSIQLYHIPKYLPDILKEAQYSVFFTLSFYFIAAYLLVSLAALLINLLLYSVAEQRYNFWSNIQEFSYLLQQDFNPRVIYDKLLKVCLEVTQAKIGWVETYHGADIVTEATHNIDVPTIKQLKGLIEHKFISLLKPYRYIENTEIRGYRTVLSVYITLHDKKKIGTIYLVSPAADDFEEEDRNTVVIFAKQAGIILETAFLLEESVENQKYQEEISISKRVHQRLLPKSVPQPYPLRISAYQKYAEQIGGDLYAFYYNEAKNILNFCVGDVSGKGASAAFYMVELKGIYETLCYPDSPLILPNKMVQITNNILTQTMESHVFITVLYAQFRLNEDTLYFARAGHTTPLYYNAKTHEAVYLSQGGLAIGLVKGEIFDQNNVLCSVKYDTGDIFVFYSDGLTETQNVEGQCYGLERLKKIVLDNAQKDVYDIEYAILQDVYKFKENTTLSDDFTLQVIKVQR
ncbi:MAG: serine/threonine-protein phosphatase [Bacteroidia bacterium]|nr:serine/threonine-protein phosphatase [Bacteroidia bacterium]MDW8302129.1 PP2C family protein-serine/threonine phosphatase [Bacteroidia bacterium]